LAARKEHLVNWCVVAVIDTVGVKTDRPLAMLDMYGTPYTRALHVVERYRLLDYEAAREGLERDAKESLVIPNTSMQRDPTYRGKYLQLLFTVEDQGVFTVPWFATITYGRPSGEWEEFVCAEGTGNAHYSPRNEAVFPSADKPFLKVGTTSWRSRLRQVWVIRVASTGSKASPNVRYASMATESVRRDEPTRWANSRHGAAELETWFHRRLTGQAGRTPDARWCRPSKLLPSIDVRAKRVRTHVPGRHPS
jgi:hypothetical protein